MNRIFLPSIFLTCVMLPIHADLVAHWTLDEGSGVLAADSTANGHDGTVAGGAVWEIVDLPPVPGGTTAALQMDGVDDQVDIVGYKGITGTGDRSISAWIKTATNATTFNMGIVSWGANVGTQKWTFRVQTQNGVAGAIRIEANGGFFVGNTVVTDGEWHHVAVTWAADASPDILDAKLYVDGELDAEFGHPTTPPSASQSVAINTASSADVRIGDDFQATHNWEGSIDEVRIYDEALDAAAIAELALGPPLVSSFDASEEVVASGDPVILSWAINPDVDRLEIDNGVGDVLGVASVTVNPTADATYTLTAGLGAETEEKEVTILVEKAPLINSFINLGSTTLREGDSTTLAWDAFGEAEITLNGTDVFGQEEIELSPSETTTYVLEATNAFGTTTQEITIEVLAATAPDLEWSAEGLPEGSLDPWDPAINTTLNPGITFIRNTGGEVQSGTSNFVKVTSWVNGPGYNLSSNPADSWQDGYGDAVTKQDVSWEIVFRPGDFLGTHTLFNTGGNGDGTAIVLIDDQLDFRVQTANTDDERLILATDLAALGDAGDFFHVVATLDADPVVPAVAHLYVNGELVVGPVTSVSPIDDWDGGDLAELGKGANIPTSTGFPFEMFTGDIASFSYFGGRVLSDAQVETRYQEVAGLQGDLVITDLEYDVAEARVTLTFASVDGRSYALDTTTDLSETGWLEVNDAIVASGPETTVEIREDILPESGSPRRFFRIRPGVR